MSQIAVIFAKNLKRLREDADLTQAELAEKIGVAHATVNAWEGLRRWPGTEQIEEVAKFFKIPEAVLFMDEATTDSIRKAHTLAEFGRLLAAADPDRIQDALDLLSIGQPTAGSAGAQDRKSAKT